MAAWHGTDSRGSVALRDVEEADLAVLFEHQLDPLASAMAAFRRRGSDEFKAHWMTVLGDPRIVKKAIVVDGTVAGHVVSFDGEGHREIGYWVGRSFWGQGVATRAVAAFLGHERVRPLFAHVAKDNAASIRVLEKCGFRRLESDGAAADANATAEADAKAKADTKGDVDATAKALQIEMVILALTDH